MGRVKFIKRVDIDRINRLDRFRKLTFRPNGFVITDYKCPEPSLPPLSHIRMR